jgi:hypothetical protein
MVGSLGSVGAQKLKYHGIFDFVSVYNILEMM